MHTCVLQYMRIDMVMQLQKDRTKDRRWQMDGTRWGVNRGINSSRNVSLYPHTHTHKRGKKRERERITIALYYMHKYTPSQAMTLYIAAAAFAVLLPCFSSYTTLCTCSSCRSFFRIFFLFVVYFFNNFFSSLLWFLVGWCCCFLFDSLL